MKRYDHGHHDGVLVIKGTSIRTLHDPAEPLPCDQSRRNLAAGAQVLEAPRHKP